MNAPEGPVTEPPHAVEVILPGTTLTLPDGTIERIYNKDVTQIDGTLIHYVTTTLTHPDGTVEKEVCAAVGYADGTRIARITHADGSITETSENKTRVGENGILVRQSALTRCTDGSSVLQATSTYTDGEGRQIITQTQKTAQADGSAATIETVCDGNGKQIRKLSEEIAADGTAVVTVDGSGLALTLKGAAGGDTLQIAGGKADPAATPKTVMINGRTWKVDGATGDGI